MRAHSQRGHTGELLNILFKSNVQLSSRVAIACGALEQIDRILTQCGISKRVGLVYQRSVADAWAMPAAEILSKIFECRTLELPDGEECKSSEQLIALWSWLQNEKFERSDCLLAIGGGSLTDVAGFSAATYLRGIKLVLAPTTLLGQVDAAIGGKTGINLPSGKNLAGSFYFPTAVIVDPLCLRTLPHRDLASGFAEIVKYALIEQTVAAQAEYRMGPQPLAQVLARAVSKSALTADIAEMQDLITASIRMKLSVVAKDPYEQSLRRSLNFGHTLGHAIEKVSGYTLKHGEAISIGMVFACRLAEKVGKLPAQETEKLVEILRKAQLPVEVPQNLSRSELTNAMTFDKKKQAGAVKFVLPERSLGFVNFDVTLTPEQLSAEL